MGCHPKPIDELIFFKMVKTTNQSLLDLEWMEQRLLHHRIGLQEHRETPETRCHFCPWNTGVSSVWFPWNQFKDSFNRLKLTIHGFNPTCFMVEVEVPTIHCSRVKVLLFSWLKSQKLLFNTEIQHFGWLNQIIHFPLKPTERSKGLVLLQVFAWHPKRSEWAEVVQREAGDCTSKNRNTPMNAYGL